MAKENVLEPLTGLPAGVHSRILPARDLDIHFLDAGERDAPLLLLLHGFPELSYSWREVLLPLSRLGYRVVAPDVRGYGRTTPREPSIPGGDRPLTYNDDLRPYRMLNLVHDTVALVHALGYKSVACLIGHDAGSSLAGYCAIVRPDVFRSIVMMSSPFVGAPSLPFALDTSPNAPEGHPTPPWTRASQIDAALAQLSPPRKHYSHYYAGPTANRDMMDAPLGLHAFLRSYFHIKSADWAGNDPHPLPPAPAPVSESYAHLPHYYVMPRNATMADVARDDAPSAHEVEAKSDRWLPDDALAVYVNEYSRTRFQGGLNRYRAMIEEKTVEELSVFAGKRIETPAMFLSGKKDWCVYQIPGALHKLQKEVCTTMAEEDVVLVDGAGHWVQQEQPEQVVKYIARFLEKL